MAPPLTLISGRVVLSDGSARQRYLLIENGKIKWISRSKPPAAFTKGCKFIETGPQDWIFPGLIDLHTHTSYHLLPLWHSPRAPFNNRHVWRNDTDYKNDVSGVNRSLRPLSHYRASKTAYSELQALAGGSTLIEQPHPLKQGAALSGTLLCRSTGSARELGLENGKTIKSYVDFFKPSEKNGTGRPTVSRYRDNPPYIEDYRDNREKYHAVLVHIAEGRSGYGSYRGADPYTRAEFEAFMAHDAMRDIEAVKAVPLSIVHGSGIDPDNTAHIDFLTKRNISVIWSPASNMILYDDSIDAGKLVDNGVNVVLGSDWSPSGSKHVWEEAKFARFFLSAIGSKFSDVDIFKMVTKNAARSVALNSFGEIAEGKAADFFILNSPIESDNALEVFFATQDKDVTATIVGGLPVYGDKNFLKQFGLPVQDLPKREGKSVRNKVVHLPKSTGITNFSGDIDGIEDFLKSQDPPILRSNLLVSSDVQYRRRMQLLRARTERYGWSVKQTARKRHKSPLGQVPTRPQTAQIQMGFLSENLILEDLKRTILPSMAMLGTSAGLTALICGIAVKSRPKHCPDYFGLQVYESTKIREATQDSSVGRRLIETLIAPLMATGADNSFMGTPKKYSGEIKAGNAYALSTSPIDWAARPVNLIVVIRKTETTGAAFRQSVKDAISIVTDQIADPHVLIAATTDCVAIWHQDIATNSGDGAPNIAKLIVAALESTAEITINKMASPQDAKAEFGERWDGLEAKRGDVLDVRFTRRALFPW